MRAVVCLAVLGLAYAAPNGLYHQEYNYKASSSTYNNNELQHKTDDQGFYSKDGDFEGRVKPRVSSNSEHSEYVNPKLRDYNTAFTGNSLAGKTSSYGRMRAESTYSAGRGKSYLVGSGSAGTRSGGYNDLEVEGLASADNIAGTRALYGLHNAGAAYTSDTYGAGSGAYGSNAYGSQAHGSNAYGSNAYGAGSYGSGSSAYGSNYGTSGSLVDSSHSYSASSSLTGIRTRVEQDLQRELQRQLQSNLAIAEQEAQLRRLISERLEEAVRQQYGQQTIRDGHSYTILAGQPQHTANFEQRDYLDLKRDLENNLLQSLRSEYNQRGSSHYSASSSSNQNQYYNQQYVQHTTTHRPVYAVPVAPQPAEIRYTPVQYPDSITTIASRVQNNLDQTLNQILDETQQRYFTASSHYTGNVDSLLERLREDLRRNITYNLEEHIRSQYGNQIEKDGYTYSLGPSGQHSTKYNYNANDLANLRNQIEKNLIDKLNRDFQTYRTRWESQQSSQYRETNSGYDYTTVRAVVPLHIGPNYGNYEYTTPRYDTRPTSASIVPLISGTKGGHRYTYSASGGYQISGNAGQNIGELQRQLQSQLGRQIQDAIARNEVARQSYARSGYGTAQTYDTSYQRLYDELNRNLTNQLQEFQYGGASGYGSSASGTSFDEAQLAQLRAQLQRDLTSQLQQGLQQSYSSSSSYSARSSSSSSSHGGSAYGGSKGYANEFGQYRTGGVYPVDGEDCVGDDPNAYRNYRPKRSAYAPYRSRPLGIASSSSGSSYSQYGYGGLYGGYSAPVSRPVEPAPPQGQVEDDSDLTQQVETADFGQVEDNSDTFAQIIGRPDQQVAQQVDDSDLTQQVEDDGFGKFTLGSQQAVNSGRRDSNADLTQQVEDAGFGRFQTGSQHSQPNRPASKPALILSVSRPLTNPSGQNYHSSNQLVGQVEDNSDLTQQEDNSGFGRLEVGSYPGQYGQTNQQGGFTNTGRQPITQTNQYPSNQVVGQVEDDSDLTQQVEDAGFGQLELGSQRGQSNQGNLGQRGERVDLAVNPVGNIPIGSQQSQFDRPTNRPLTISTIKSSAVPSGNPYSSNQVVGQVEDNSDLTQQEEVTGFGNLEIGSHHGQFGQNHQQHGSTHFGQQHQHIGQTSQYPSYQVVGQVEDDSDLTQQVEDSGYGKLETLNQQGQRGHNQQQPTNLGQQQIGEVYDTDLTQQEDDGFGQFQLGSQSRPQTVNTNTNQPENARTHVSNANIQLSNTGSFKPLQSPTQSKITNQLEGKLTEQIEEACNQLLTSTTNQQISYQKLLSELNSNISREISNLQQEDYKFSVNFDKQQTTKLQQQLENTLKMTLQQNVQKVYNQQQISVGQQLEDDTDLSQKQEDSSFGIIPNQNQQAGRGQIGFNSGPTQPQGAGPKQFGNINQQTSQTTDDHRNVNLQTGQSDNRVTQSTQHNIDYNRQRQIEEGYLSLGSTPERPVKPVGPVNNYDFHQREINGQNDYNQVFQTGTPQRPNLPTLNQVINENQENNRNQINLQNKPNILRPIDNNDLIQKTENTNQSELDDNFLVTGLSNSDTSLLEQTGSQSPSSRPSSPKQTPSTDIDSSRPNTNDLQSNISPGTYPDYVSLQSGTAQYVPYNQRPASSSYNPSTSVIQTDSSLQYGNHQPASYIPYSARPNPVASTTVTRPTDSLNNSPKPSQPGSSFGFTSQGQLVERGLTLEEANRQADLILEQIRKVQQSQSQLSSQTHQESASPQSQFSGNLNVPVVSQPTGQNVPASNGSPVLNNDNTNKINGKPNANSESRELATVEVSLTKNQLVIAKQLEDEIVKQLEDAVQNQHDSAKSYSYAYNQLKEQLHQNLTEFIAGATEPGLSKYSEQITSNFKGSELNDLQDLLEKRCSQKLEQTLNQVYYGYSYSSSSSGSYNHQSSHRYSSSHSHHSGSSGYGSLNYGRPNQVDVNFETAPEIQPQQPQQANAVQNVVPVRGVKGGRRQHPQAPVETIGQPQVVGQSRAEVSIPQQGVVHPDQQVEIVDPELTSTTEQPGWWKRFGNKVTQGARNLKEKVGL